MHVQATHIASIPRAGRRIVAPNLPLVPRLDIFWSAVLRRRKDYEMADDSTVNEHTYLVETSDGRRLLFTWNRDWLAVIPAKIRGRVAAWFHTKSWDFTPAKCAEDPRASGWLVDAIRYTCDAMLRRPELSEEQHQFYSTVSDQLQTSRADAILYADGVMRYEAKLHVTRAGIMTAIRRADAGRKDARRSANASGPSAAPDPTSDTADNGQRESEHQVPAGLSSVT